MHDSLVFCSNAVAFYTNRHYCIPKTDFYGNASLINVCVSPYNLGVCQCDDGYSGIQCSIYKSTQPFVMKTLFNGTSCDTCGCDIQQTEDCSAAIIYGANFVDSSTLTCHYQFVKARFLAYIITISILCTV